MKEELILRITDYLEAGGLFNPEMMEHDKVRDLLVDCREFLRNQPRPVPPYTADQLWK